MGAHDTLWRLDNNISVKLREDGRGPRPETVSEAGAESESSRPRPRCRGRCLTGSRSREYARSAMRCPLLALVASLALLPASVSAQEDGQLRLMREPHSYVDVADAFDGEDPFDLNVRVGFRHEQIFGAIQREPGALGVSGDPNRASRNWVTVAHHNHSRNLLDLALDVGIFRDLAVYARMPIILSDDRSLSAVPGAPAGILDADDRINPGDPASPPLFSVPFQSPTRSGLDYIAAGFAWSIFNQNRDPSVPTWVLMAEGRFNVGDPLQACRGGATTACRRWSEPNPNEWDHDDLGLDAGETRGTNGLRIETRASWRAGYVEPYAGLLFQIEWPVNAEQFFLPAGNINGFINDKPPIVGQLTGGMAIFPWEDRAQFQRFGIDLRFSGRYISEGRGYSPLFDALGTSQNRYPHRAAARGRPHARRRPPRGAVLRAHRHAVARGARRAGGARDARGAVSPTSARLRALVRLALHHYLRRRVQPELRAPDARRRSARDLPSRHHQPPPSPRPRAAGPTVPRRRADPGEHLRRRHGNVLSGRVSFAKT